MYVFTNLEPFLKLTPSFGNMFGDTLIELSGMTFHRNAVYKCKFDDVMVNATYLNRDQLYCLSPSFDHTGKINFTLSVSGILEPFEMHSVFQSSKLNVIAISNIIHGSCISFRQ